MDIETLLLYVTGILVAGLLVAFWSLLRQVLGVRLQKTRIEIHPFNAVPDYVRELFSPGETALLNYGFEPSHSELHTDPLADARAKNWSLVYVNRNRFTFARLAATWDLGRMPGYDIEFSSDFSDGTSLLTLNGRSHKYPDEPSSVIIVDPYVPDLDRHWRAHLQALEQLSKTPVLLETGKLTGKRERMWHDYVDRLLRDGWLTYSRGRYRFTVPAAFRYLAGLILGEGRLYLSKLKAAGNGGQVPDHDGRPGSRTGAAGSVDSEVEAFRRIEAVRRHRPLIRTGGILLYLSSILLFCLAFGVTMTPGSLLVLAAALLIHEAGHRLGLRMTRESSGAEMNMEPSDAGTQWKSLGLRRRAVSTLLGPLPGIIVGHILLAAHLVLGIDFLHNAAVIVLAVNFMDLLPLLPMDGGRLLQLVLVGRFPRLMLSFAVISASAFAAAGFHLRNPYLLALGVLIFFTLPLQWRNSRALARYQKLSGTEIGPPDERSRLKNTFEVLSGMPFGRLSFKKKIPVAEHLMEFTVSGRSPMKVALCALLVYVLGFTIPATSTMGYVTFLPFIMRVHELRIEEMTAREKEAEWEGLIARAASPEERWKIHMQTGDWFYDTDDTFEAAVYYEKAMEEAENFDRDDLRLGETLFSLGRVSEDPEIGRDYLEKALAIQEKELNAVDSAIAGTLEELVWVCDLWGNESDLAISCLKRALAIRREKLGSEHPSLAPDLALLGSLYDNTGFPGDAERYWLEALSVLEASADPPEDVKREVLRNLSSHYRGREKIELARKYEARLAEFEKSLADKNEG